MKTIWMAAFCLVALNAVGQRLADNVALTTWKPPYTLSKPTGWTSERFPIPIDFAPQIPFKGVEELRFAPGWGKRSSADYWSYAYVWWIEGSPAISATNLQTYLTAYYSGLVARNSTSRTGLPAKGVPTTVLMTKEKTTGDDVYRGTIQMLDYMGQSPVTLNCLIQVKNCKNQNHTAVLVAISPKPAEHSIWQTLNGIQRNFVCTR